MIIRKEHPWCCRAWTTPAGQVCVGAPAGAQTTSGKFNYLSIRDHWTFFSCTSINMQFPPPPRRRRSTSTTRRHAIPCRGLPSPHADLSFHPAPPHMSRPPLILSWGVVYFVYIRVGGAGVCEVVFCRTPVDDDHDNNNNNTVMTIKQLVSLCSKVTPVRALQRPISSCTPSLVL